MPDLKPVWGEVEKLLTNGFNLIPVRDRDEMVAGTMRYKKTSYGSWKRWQIERVTREELYHEMSERDTTAVAIICGNVSGNLEVIDIDVKYKAGIDGALFSAIREIMPDIWPKLRIHSSPSGGFHILYRVYDVAVEGNQKIASRPPTEQELDADRIAGKKSQNRCFIETRGEGGYVVAPPSLGYGVQNDVPVPILLPAQRESLLNICRSFNQVVKIEKAYTPTKSDDQYYDVNPFVDYNQSSAAEQVLADNGWRYAGQDADRIFYTRPGADKTGGVSAAFLKAKRLFYIFTTSTNLEADRCFHPATILAELQFNGDRKKAYQYLVAQGYGRIRQKVEASIAKTKAIQGKPLPANISEEGRQEYERLANQLTELHPYGIFWTNDENGAIRIHRERFYMAAEGCGFRCYRDEMVQIEGYKVHKRSQRQFFDTMKEYIKEDDYDLYLDICNAYESFVQKSGTFTATRLKLLHDHEIIRDSAAICFKFFLNGFLAITSEGVTLCDYGSVQGLVWADSIRPREYRFNEEGGKFLKFVRLSTRFTENADYIMKIIGYLAHDHKDETTGYIIVMTEECPDPRQGGGSGKNLFCSLFENCTSYMGIPGAQVKYDEKFLQSWGGQRVFAISDAPKHFDFSFLKELATGNGIVKKLFKDEVSLTVGEMPKIVVQTNFSYEITDGGLKRRIKALEFTDFFTKQGGVDVYFGCYFPDGWTGDDWAGYDTFIAECIRLWLAGGRKIEAPALSIGGWLKQFDQSFGELTRVFIEENIAKWQRDHEVTLGEFNTDYERYCNENAIQPKFRAGPKAMANALIAFCAQRGIRFENNVSLRRGYTVQKYKIFGPGKGV